MDPDDTKDAPALNSNKKTIRECLWCHMETWIQILNSKEKR